jgi:hypothetical protein
MARVRVCIGSVDVRLDGVAVSLRQVRDLMKLAAALSVVAEGQEEEEARTPVGFAAQIERLPEEIPQEDLSWYFDEKATGGPRKA